jgi:putative tricarboxylic transport membrane protein
MREGTADLIGAGLLVALGAAFAVGSLSAYEVITEEGRIGPGFMPFFSGTLLVVFGAMVGVGALRRARGASRPEGDVRDVPEGGVEASAGRTVGFVFGLTLVAILLIPVLGFLISFGLLVFALIRFVEGESLLRAIVVAVGAVIAAWLVFMFFLQIPLPTGIFGLGG